MDTGIGATLREARIRRKIELSEVEAAIKIRVRYLLAIENEEWDVLPGVAYTRGFVRTYAYYLGLDGERLADEYRHGVAPPGGDRVPKRVEPVPAAAPRPESRLSGRALVVA
ncbi:MAG TPA: helix-turn-helix domain-containing protein, partial [Solirubrobacterales bacterium]